MDLSSRETKIGIIIIVVGILFLINNFGVINIGGFIWKLWPLILIWWGLSKLRSRGRRTEEDTNFQFFGDAVISSDSPYIRHSSAFGDIRIKVERNEFAGGNTSSVFGKISIDLTGIGRITGYGQLDIHSVFGDVILRLPENIPYRLEGSSVFGSVYLPGGRKIDNVDYRSPLAEGDEKALVINLSQVFGDMEVLH